MTKRQPDIERLDIDHGTSDAPPPRRQTTAHQCAPGYIWNSSTQELIPVLPKDHPDYAQNAEIIAAALRRWDAAAKR